MPVYWKPINALPGILQPSTLVEPIVARHNDQSQTRQRHFSSFPLTSHLHNPAFRLVSLHSSLSLIVSFLRVPEIHDGYEYNLFISQKTTVVDLITSIIDELGLAKSLPIPGAGNLEYVVEEVWSEGEFESMWRPIALLICAYITLTISQGTSRLLPTTLIFRVIELPFSANPFSSMARRKFRFCVPDEWYRRSKSRNVSPAPYPSESTLKRLAALQESPDEEQDDDEGTVTISKATASVPGDTAKAVEQRGLVTQARLSNMFENWLWPTSPPSSNRTSVILAPGNRKSVSEPKLAPASGIIKSRISSETSEEGSDGDFDAAFERMLVSRTYVLSIVFLICRLPG